MRKLTAILIMTVMLSTVAQASFGQRAPVVQPPNLDNSTNPANPRQAETPRPAISERQALDIARQQFEGNVLRISLIGQGASLSYQIRMENDGKIFTVFVNANTGAVSGG